MDIFSTQNSTGSHFRILTVCTGNICRSPLVEQYLRHSLHSFPQISVESAGTMARDGQDMPEQAKDLAKRRGLPLDGHSARYLQAQHVSGADLILVMEREHRRAVVSMFPRAAALTFTVREFQRLSAGLTSAELAPTDARSDVAGRLRAGVAAVAARRGLVPGPVNAADDDVVDPYRLADAVFDQSASQMYPAADAVIRVLRASALDVSPDGR